MDGSQQNRLRLQLRGKDEDNGDLSLPVLIQHLSKLRTVLNRVRDDVVKDSAVRYFVSGLSHQSPTMVEIEAAQPRPGVRSHLRVIEETYEGLKSVGVAGVVPQGYSNAVIKSLSDFVKYANRQSEGATLFRNGDSLTIDTAFEATLAKAIGHTLYEVGTVTGYLERFNTLDNKREFTLRRKDGGPNVSCRFPTSLLDDAAANVLALVEVTGRLGYHPGQLDPYVLHARELHVILPRGQRPSVSLRELRGVASKAGEAGSSKTIIDSRMDWDDD